MEAYTVLDTLNKVEAEAPVNTPHHCLSEVKPETPGEKLRDVNAEGLVDTHAEVTTGNVAETLTDLNFASPLVTLAPTLQEMDAERPGKTLSDLEFQTVVEALSTTL